MLLNKIHIENFGKLSNFSYDFNAGLNTICKENGFGKTTLATFIKAMLYGMNNRSVKDLSKNERKKYYPWQGGKYGGYIEFEMDNKRYRLERFFGKTEKDDTVTLYNLNNNKEEYFEGELGEAYFGIDADGFMKSIYFTESETLNFENSSMQTVLSNSVNVMTDMGEYERALSVLDDKRKQYFKNGGGGKINELKTNINEISRQLDDVNQTELLCKNYKELIESLKKELSDLENEKSKLNTYISSNQRQLEMIAKMEHLKSLENDVENLTISLKECSLFFAKHLPTNSEINDMILLENEVRDLKVKFSNLMPSESDYLFYETNKGKYDKITDKIVDNSINTALNNNSKKNNKSSKAKYVFYIMSILAVVGGIVLFNKINIASFLLLGTSIIFLIIAIILTVKKGKKNVAINDDLLFKELGIDVKSSNYINQLFELKSNLSKWQKIDVYLKQTRDETLKTKKELEEKENRLNYFLLNFKTSQTDDLTVSLIESKLQTYNLLQSQLTEKNKELVQFKQNNSLYANEQDFQNTNIDNDLSRIENQIYDVKNRILETNQKLKNAQELLSLKNEYERELEQYQQAYDNAVKDYEMVVKTMDFIKFAKDNLNSKFLLPMQKNLNEIFSSLNTGLNGQIVLDTDLNASVDVGGEYKLSDYFSRGYKVIINFCTRLSFIKSVYKDKSPFLILDDPFLGLDSDNFEKVKNFIANLAKEYQVIYLICNSNREID